MAARVMARWRGLAALVRDGVEHGSRAVEQLQRDVAAQPLAILAAVPGLAAHAETVRAVHGAVVGGTHAAIRLANRVVGTVVDRVLDHLEPPTT
jgi:hypothetical protein